MKTVLTNQEQAMLELALMGRAQKILNRDKEHLDAMFIYLASAMGINLDPAYREEYVQTILKYAGKADSYVVCNTILDMPMVAVTLRKMPKKGGYVLSYVANMAQPMFSEMGDCTFALKSDNFYHRLG